MIEAIICNSEEIVLYASYNILDWSRADVVDWCLVKHPQFRQDSIYEYGLIHNGLTLLNSIHIIKVFVPSQATYPQISANENSSRKPEVKESNNGKKTNDLTTKNKVS